MSFKKLSRIAMVAFVLVAVLAVSAFAYGVDVAGMVTGLENGVNYTYAQYDFATDAYGEVTELTADTVLTSGVWGIKADGEEDYSPVFVYGSQTGHMSYLDYTLLGKSGTATPTGNESVGKVIDNSNDLEYLSPGKWSTSGMGNGSGAYYQALSYPQYYTNGTNAVSLYLAIFPSYFADWKDVTVGEEDEAVTTKQWVVKDTVTGYDTVDEMLQASSIYYGFSNEQVVPADKFTGFTSGSYGFSLGFTGTNCSAITFTPRITYYVKNPGSETIGEYYYVVEGFVSKNAITFGVPADMPEEGYIVGFRLQPYYNFTVEQLLDIPTQYNSKDDGYTIRTQPKYTSGVVTEEAQTTRASHFGLHPNDDNDFEYTAPTYAAPAGIGVANGEVTGLVDGKYYQYANVSVGNGVVIEYGEPAELTADTEVKGLFAVRETDADSSVFSEWSDLFFIEGGKYVVYHQTTMTEETGIDANGDGITGGEVTVLDYAYLTDNADNRATIQFTSGKWMGLGATNHKIVLGYSGWHNAYRIGGVGNFEQTKEMFNTFYYTYKFNPEEIIKMADFGSFSYSPHPRVFSTTFDGTIQSRVDFVVITDEGVIERRSAYADHTMKDGKPQKVTHTVTADSITEKDGYIVGIIVYPWWIPDGVTLTAGSNKPSTALDLLENSWVIDEFVPVPTGLSIANGKVTGLESGRTYEYCQSGAETTVYPLTANTVVYGDIKVRVYSAKGTTAVSAWTEALTSDRTAAPTGISFVDGMPVDLEDGIFYEYKAVTIGDNAAIEEGAETAFNAASTGIYGLVKVREVNEAGTAGTAWTSIIYSAGESYDILHTEYKTGSKQSGNVPLIKSATHTADTTYFNAGLWTGNINLGWQLNSSTKSLLSLGTTGAYGADVAASFFNSNLTYEGKPSAVPTEVNATPENANELYAKLKKTISDIRFTYEFLPEEIIPMNEFGSYTFGVYKRQGYSRASGTLYTKFTFIVIDEDGQVDERVVYKAISGNFTETEHTVTLADFTAAGCDTDGYIVGMVINPYVTNCGGDETAEITATCYVTQLTVANATKYGVTVDPTWTVTSSKYYSADGTAIYHYLAYGHEHQAILKEDAWKVVEYVAEPTGISIVDGKVTGLESGRTYEYCQSGAETTVYPLTADTIVYGDIKVRVYSAKGTTAVSAWTEALTSDRTAPTGISFVNGQPVDLEDGLLYQYRNVSLASNGEGVALGSAATLSGTSTDVYGLVQVREVNADATAYTDWSGIIYSAGESYDIIHTTESAKAKLQLYYLVGSYSAGYTTANAYYYRDDSNESYYLYSDHTKYTGDGTFYPLYVGTTSGEYYYKNGSSYYKLSDGSTSSESKTLQYTATDAYLDVIDVVSAGALPVASEERSVIFNTAKWTGYGATTSQALNYQQGAYTLGTTDGYGPNFTNDYLDTATGVYTLTDEAKEALKAGLSDVYYSYGFKAEEIIPVESFSSFTYRIARGNGDYKYAGTMKSSFSLVVLTEDGKIEERTISKVIETYSTLKTAPSNVILTVTLQDFIDGGFDVDGYVVGMVIYPYVYDEATDVSGSSYLKDKTNVVYAGYNTNFRVLLYEDGFKVEVSALDVTGGETINGIDADKTYQYKSYTINSDGSALEATEWTALDHDDIPAGLLRVREVISDAVVTAPSNLIYVYGDEADRKDFERKDDGTGTYVRVAGDTFVIGSWTGTNISTSYTEARTTDLAKNSISAGGGQLSSGTYAKALIEATAAGDDTAIAAAQQAIADYAPTIEYRYAYTSGDIVPVADMYSINFSVRSRMIGGSSTIVLGDASLNTMFTVYVADKNGEITEYYWKAATEQDSWTIHVVDFASDDNWVNGRPTEGWVVAIAVNPWTDVVADNVTYDQNRITASYPYGYNTIATFVLEEYNLAVPAETPVLELTNLNAVITVANYNSGYTYAYSDDNGDSWTAFSGNYFHATKANTEYVVKALGTAPIPDSDVSAPVTSPMVLYVGQSLVLDGQIAVRYYMDIADYDNLEVLLNLTKVNTDDSSRTFYGSRKITVTDSSVSSPIQYDANKGLYFVEIYEAAKDVDNVTFETSLGYWPVGTTESDNRINVANPGVNIETYITEALARAEAGQDEFVAAENVINMLATYAQYADNYFGTADALEAYTSTALAGATIDAANCTDSLANLEFVGTSLLLEDNVTIRHYFKVVGDYTFDAEDYAVDPATVTVKIKNNGYYVCFDITDVPAHKIGDAYTLTITGAEGKADAGNVATVTYSVANYLANASSSYEAGSKMYNLANVMYDYYVEAKAYYDLKH